MKIGELAQQAGVSTHTLRYYEKIGLLPYARRDSSGQRDYGSSILPWLAFIHRLKQTGMPIKEMLEYSRLRELGGDTQALRLKLLEKHRDRMEEQLASLMDCKKVIDKKITGYRTAIERSVEYGEASFKGAGDTS